MALRAPVFALTRPGLFSLDAALGLEGLWAPTIAGLAHATGMVGALGNLLVRRPAATG